ncbi:IpaD/SipD/SspD family type III secretion system needle tip protein [Proteus alimentorum]|uniref:IpaD/SipD/SspD family type III secretion system needle tip protein n=1 Tax=Proteus alimentorum TaxID=1973495 RepID=A0ABS0IXV7_9GAMM|nr:IpaD/SipD/SspD family type III secretion system needle tip protein [Proteus alimentorum]MBG2877161.1 IpaD/SipD/SspD family type III secretion system needle tip protein [Proteus alimentorum]MBG2880882.1 IpaD/SipD/SspD family type III secretion system needle tip protein [Proteus alimentorum]
MVTAINSDVSKTNNKSYVENKPTSDMVHNQDEFLINSDILLKDVKRKYQEIYLNDMPSDSQFEGLSDKEKCFYLDEKYVKNDINKNNSLKEINQFSRALNSVNPKNDYPIDSLSDLFNEVKQSIVSGKNDYLDVLKDIFSKYMDFVKKLREILSELSQAAKAGSKDGYININVTDILNELGSLITSSNRDFDFGMRFFKENDGRFYRMINGEKIYYKNETEMNNAVSAVKKLLDQIKGLSPIKENKTIYSNNIYFSFGMSFDDSAIKKLIDYLMNMPIGGHDILQTEFELLKKTFDTVEKGINTNLDELSKKYSAANSNYDNFVKIVSSTMNTLLEMAKGFLRF